MEGGKYDNIIADELELAHYIKLHAKEPLKLRHIHLEREYYSILFPIGSDLKKKVDVELLEILKTDDWNQKISTYYHR